MNTLIIDTSSNKHAIVGLEIDGELDAVKQHIDTRKAQVVIPLFSRLLKKHSLKMSDITNIEVNTGPGSFTGIRVGISIANALSFALQIPINKKAVGEFVDPIY